MKQIIETIFPTSILVSRMPRSFTDLEWAVLDNYREAGRKNTGNWVSTHADVLENEAFTDIKQILLEQVNFYAQHVLRAHSDIEFYISISWLNWTEKAQYHHKHHHQNSILSGVLYFECDDHDSIVFYKPMVLVSPYTFEPDHQGYLNSDIQDYFVSSGDILIFPSWLEHSVKTKNTDGVRISLAFNTFVRGALGNSDSKTLLKLP